MERAARRPRIGMRDRAGNRRQPRPRLGQHAGDRAQQRPRIRMPRRMEDRVDRALLHLVAEIHHHDIVGHLGDHAHVVGDQDHRQAALLLQPADQLQDLRLRGDVQRRRRLVGDQHARLGGQRQRDHHALPQAAGQFERIRIDALRRPRNADQRQQFDRPRPRGALRQCGVQPDRLDELVADGVERRQRAHRLLEHQADFAAADRAHVRAVGGQRHQVRPC